MTLDQIIEIADKAYPDGFVRQHYEAYVERADAEQRRAIGDTLAEFIAVELAETYDDSATDEEQIAEALRVMQRAADEVQAVADAFATVEIPA